MYNMTDNIWGDSSWKFHGNRMEIGWNYGGNFMEIGCKLDVHKNLFRKCQGNVKDVSRKNHVRTVNFSKLQ